VPPSWAGKTFGDRLEHRSVTVWVVVVIAWLALGAVAVAVMWRRGHDAFSWGIVFLFLGPLAIPLAFSAQRHPPPQTAGRAHPGAFDVLVAHDGSQAADDALAAALERFAPSITSLTLAAVVDVESATTVRGRETEHETYSRLDAVAGRLDSIDHGLVETVVLHGDPAVALAEFAEQHGYELLVVGGSGPGGSRVLRGSVARRLAMGGKVPVLIGPVQR
jgi:nucleotide-binding universal stress UspA family protein